jgi:hypothetical protein
MEQKLSIMRNKWDKNYRSQGTKFTTTLKNLQLQGINSYSHGKIHNIWNKKLRSHMEEFFVLLEHNSSARGTTM